MRLVQLTTLVLCLLPLACLGPDGQEMSAAEYKALESAEVDAALAGQPAGGGLSTLPEQRRRLQEELTAQQAGLAALADRRIALALEHEMAVADEAWELKQRQVALARAREDAARFQKVEWQRRLDEHALVVQEADDALMEDREELAQLEQTYAGVEDDGTVEIVLERARRRVARAEERLRIARERHIELANVVLPRELADLGAAVEELALAVTNAERAVKLGELRRQAELVALDVEERALRQRLDEVARRQDDLADPRGWDG